MVSAMSEPDAIEERSSRPDDDDRGHTIRVVLVVAALAAGFALVPRLTQNIQSSRTGGPAPDFTASVVANAEPGQPSFTLSAFAGKPVLLDFWATWCPPCQAEMPVVDGIAERFKDRGLVVVGVNTSDQPGLAERFVAKKRVRFSSVFDQENTIARAYGVENLPTLVVVSREGKIVAVRQGVTSESELERIVRRVL